VEELYIGCVHLQDVGEHQASQLPHIMKETGPESFWKIFFSQQ
jgi:hypothetical protein